MVVRVAGIPKYRARLGTCDGRRAVTITGPVSGAGGVAVGAVRFSAISVGDVPDSLK